MILKSIYLQHFRSYKQQKFDFTDTVTVVIGPNTAGKTNLSEAIHLLSTGKSFRTSSDAQMIAFGEDVGRVGGIIEDENIHIHKDPNTQIGASLKPVKVEVVLVNASVNSGRFSKKFFVNGIAKSRTAIRNILPIVLFRPEELDIVIDSPSIRREFLDSVLEQTDREYAQSLLVYHKALKQRNALLDIARESGRKNKEQFAYWDKLLIENGQVLTQKREELIAYLNESVKEIFPLTVMYDHSKISFERLLQYEDAEIGVGNTLVGPHRDDFFMTMDVEGEARDIKHFGSRGQQRLVVLQLKLLQIAYMQEKLNAPPLLVLDDIFSELDSGHIELVLQTTKGCQTIITTTHKEFIPGIYQKKFGMIELEKEYATV